MIVLAGYISVIFLFLAIVAREIYRLYKLAASCHKQHLKDLTIVFTSEKDTPFSWFRRIYWNTNIDINSAVGRSILHHETIHVHQHHSTDRLFMNIASAIFWINPFFWLIRKELAAVHEFIADAAAVEKSDASIFSQMVLACSYPGYRFGSTSFFNSSSIKRRILMLKKIKTASPAYYARLLCIPVVFLLFAAFSVRTGGAPSTSGTS